MSSATAVLVGIIGEDRYGASCLAAGSEAELEWSGVEWSMGFLDCLRREGGEGGREGCQVSQLVAGGPGGSLSVETSGGWGYLQFSLGHHRTDWWWRSPVLARP